MANSIECIIVFTLNVSLLYILVSSINSALHLEFHIVFCYDFLKDDCFIDFHILKWFLIAMIARDYLLIII